MKVSTDKKGVVFLVLILAVIVAAGVFIAVSLNADPESDSLRSTDVIKTMLVISDDDGNALATDVIFYSPKTHKVALFNIPGNTGDIFASLTDASGKQGRTDRIDAVYREKGIDAYALEVGKLLGKDISFTLEITLDNFGLLTDLLGGMKLFVPNGVDVRADDGSARWLLPGGSVTLDGDKIQTYMSYKLSEEEDTDVMDRRQNAVVSLLTAFHEQRSVLLDKKNFPLYAEKIKTSSTQKILYRLLEHLSNINTENDRLVPNVLQGSLRTLPSSQQKLLFPLYNGEFIKNVVDKSIEELVNEGGTNYRYVVEVLNGTMVQGAAANTAILLKGLGNYDILPPQDADRNDYEHTVIINHMQSASTEALKSLASFINCKNLEHRPSSGATEVSSADFTIILGKDWDGRYVQGGYENPNKEEESEVDSVGGSVESGEPDVSTMGHD